MQVCRRTAALPCFAGAACVALYRAVPGEVNVDDLALGDPGTRIFCVPALDRRTGRYRMARWDEATTWTRGAFGIPEPSAPRWIDPASLDALVVPGVAFDRAGRRLGRGGGHYDGLLRGLRAQRIGVAFAWQVVPRVPTGPGDEPVHWLVTPEDAVACPPDTPALYGETET